MKHRLLVTLALAAPIAPAWGLDVQVEIQGLDAAQEQNVRLFLGLEQERERAGLDVGRVRYLSRQAPEQIRAALRPFGFFDPQIEEELQESAERVVARYRITPEIGRAHV
jgi:translocation and assembly module TamA